MPRCGLASGVSRHFGPSAISTAPLGGVVQTQSLHAVLSLSRLPETPLAALPAAGHVEPTPEIINNSRLGSTSIFSGALNQSSHSMMLIRFKHFCSFGILQIPNRVSEDSGACKTVLTVTAVRMIRIEMLQRRDVAVVSKFARYVSWV